MRFLEKKLLLAAPYSRVLNMKQCQILSALKVLIYSIIFNVTAAYPTFAREKKSCIMHFPVTLRLYNLKQA
jgi:hypothetical protein